MARSTTRRTFSDEGIDLPPGASGEVDLLCPECSAGRRREHQREKCLSVNVEAGYWKCHNCGWQGSLRDADWRDELRPRWKPGNPPAPLVKKKPIPKPMEIPSEGLLEVDGIAFFQGRGIPATVARRFGVWSERRRFGGIEKPCVCFPYRIGGQVVNVKYRALDKHFQLAAGMRVVFFNLDAVAGMEEGEVVIVEGEMDVMALSVAGIDTVISVPNGANSLTDEAMESIAHLFEKPDIRFTIAVDADGPGRGLMMELAQRLGIERCRRVIWPDGVKDANDLLMDAGADALREAVRDAQYFPIDELIATYDQQEGVTSLYEHGLPGGYDVGFDAMRGLWSVRAGELNLVTGVPGSGKSHFVDQTNVNLSALHGLRHGVFSPEMGPAARHIADLSSKYLGLPFYEGPTPRMTPDQLGEAMEWLNDHFWWLEMDDPNLDKVLDLFRVAHFRHGINTVTIDPWNELETDYGRLTETQFIAKALTKINRFLKLHGLIGTIVAHPTKLMRDATTGKYPVVTPWDVAGSANWFNKSNAIVSVHRDRSDPTSLTQIHIQKMRFRELGRLGTGELKYDTITGSFLDPGTPVGGYPWQRKA